MPERMLSVRVQESMVMRVNQPAVSVLSLQNRQEVISNFFDSRHSRVKEALL